MASTAADNGEGGTFGWNLRGGFPAEGLAGGRGWLLLVDTRGESLFTPFGLRGECEPSFFGDCGGSGSAEFVEISGGGGFREGGLTAALGGLVLVRLIF